ncbi:MAG: hypothetical protein JWQ62_1252 [Lacunisphaera sp.]|nr:hypothetical protein [Lacunisphaera sp.]
MRSPFFALCSFAVLASAGCAAPAMPTELFNGHDFAGWEFVTTPATDIGAVCKIQPDGVIAAAGAPVGFIATTARYENFRLHAEWRWPGKPGNGGVLLHIASGPKDRAWPLSLQVQLKNKSAGDLLPMAGATFTEPLTSAAGAPPARTHTAPDSEQAAGAWNTCDVVCRDGTVEVEINGVVQNQVTGVSPRAGRIGFQFESAPFELRHVRVVRLD